MSEQQRSAARRRFLRENTALCPSCRGSGLVAGQTIAARAKKGGVRNFVASLEKGSLSMSERGKRGGRPSDPTIKDLLEQ